MSFALVDTPGFNDTYLDDAAVLSELATFMESSYKAKIKLTAIIYLHPITSHRLEGSARDNLSMFRKLCGPNFYPNIVLATNFWSLVDEGTGHRREVELEENEDFWGAMKSHGSQITRLPDDKEACVQLLLRLAGKEKATLQIQNELVEKQMPIGSTEAGASAKNTRELQNFYEEFRQRVASLASDRKAEIQKQQEEFRRIQAEQQEEFEAQMRKYKEEIDEARKKNEALLREAEETRKKKLEEQEEIVRQTKLETEKIQQELERLSLQEKQKQAERAITSMVQARDTKLTAIRLKRENQTSLFNTAQTAGSVKANVSFTFQSVGHRICDLCVSTCSAQLVYCKSTRHRANFSVVQTT